MRIYMICDITQYVRIHNLLGVVDYVFILQHVVNPVGPVLPVKPDV